MHFIRAVIAYVAQEVEETVQAAGYEFSGVDALKSADDRYGLRYAEFVVPLVNAVRELSAANVGLRDRILQLEMMVNTPDGKNSGAGNESLRALRRASM